MKCIKSITPVVLVFFFFWSGNQPSTRKIDPGNFENKEFCLSTIASDVSYLPLSSDVLLGTIKSIAFNDSLIFIYDRSSEGLQVFNKKGNYKYRIGKKGNGPGEYSAGIAFSIDRKEKVIYILDKIIRKKVMAFSFSGKFLYEFPNDKLGGNFQEIVTWNGKIYLFEFIVAGKAMYNWIVLDTKGNVLSQKVNSVKTFRAGFTIMINPVFEFDNKVCYWNQYNDTIFQIGNRENSARYLFANSKYRLPLDDSKDISPYFIPRQIIETPDYLVIRIFNFSKYEIVVINKQTGEAVAPGKGENSKGIQPGLQNDIDGGIRFDPQKLIETGGQKYLISWMDAIQLKTHVTSDAFKNSTPKFPEKKTELEKLANRLNENDNPVLMLVKLKD